MRAVPINQAEAIIEPYWDGGSSEHPDNKANLLGAYTIWQAPQAQVQVRQNWCAVEISLDQAVPGLPACRMSREVSLEVSRYDQFIVFGAIPAWVSFDLDLLTDAGWEHPFIQVTGRSNTDEYLGPIAGTRIHQVVLTVQLLEPKPTVMTLHWLGLANQARRLEMEAQPSPYTSDWPGCFQEIPTWKPQLALLADETDFARLRQRISQEPYRTLYQRIRAKAVQDLELVPEKEVGRLIGKPDRRWCRTRDMNRPNLAESMERLAFVGMLEEDERFSRMACRMALAAAHSEYWCESDMGIFPGATWHHRSFTETIYCTASALVLGWAGGLLSPHGRQIIEDAIIMKGLPRIDSDFRRMEYIRSMNQGIVFSSGRIFGLIAAAHSFPRYRILIEEAARDLDEMVAAYVQSDGGTLEGPGYWNFTFADCLTVYRALARYQGKPLHQTVPKVMRETGRYALTMLSAVGDRTSMLPVNDAHSGVPLRLDLVASFAQISPDPAWNQLFLRMLQRQDLNVNFAALLIDPPDLTGIDPADPVSETWSVMPETGQLDSVRPSPGLGHVQLHFCSGSTYRGHYHEDKGSLIVQSARGPLLMDRGVTHYDHPETYTLKLAQRHNLLLPLHADEAILHQPGDAAGGRITDWLREDHLVAWTGDQRLAWPEGLFTLNRKRVFSPCAELILIDDEIILSEPIRMRFILNLPQQAFREGSRWRLMAPAGHVDILPLNWTPEDAISAEEGIDDQLQPVWILALQSARSRTHRLLTVISLADADVSAAQTLSVQSSQDGRYDLLMNTPSPVQLSVQIHPAGQLICQLPDQGRYIAEGDLWYKR